MGITYEDLTPSHAQTIEIRKLSKSKKLDFNSLEDILCQKKGNQNDQISFNKDKIESVLPTELLKRDKRYIERYIIKAIFKLSSGIYLAEMVKETTTLTVMDIIFQQEGFIVIGCLYFVLGLRYGKLNKDSFGKIMYKVLYGMPMYYLIYLNMCLMDGLTGIMIFLILYLIIVNINFLISKRIKELYNVATGNIGTEEHEKELEEVDVVFTKQEVENKDNKKGRGVEKFYFFSFCNLVVTLE